MQLVQAKGRATSNSENWCKKFLSENEEKNWIPWKEIPSEVGGRWWWTFGTYCPVGIRWFQRWMRWLVCSLWNRTCHLVAYSEVTSERILRIWASPVDILNFNWGCQQNPKGLKLRIWTAAWNPLRESINNNLWSWGWSETLNFDQNWPRIGSIC